MKNTPLSAAFLPGGELIVGLFGAVQRLDPSGKKVLAKRKVKSLPAFTISSSGRLFIADGSKVFEHDPMTLKPMGKPLRFPADRGASGALSSLAISPDESTLAGITRGNTLHVQQLGGNERESHPGYGARREALAFLGPRTLLNVHGNTTAEVLTLGAGRSSANLGGTFAAGGEGHFITWSIGGDDAKLFDTTGKALGTLPFKLQSAAFSKDLVVVASEDEVAVFGLKSRKESARLKLRGSGLLALGTDRVAVGTNEGLVMLSFPALEPLSALPRPLPAAKQKAPATVKAKKPRVHRPSALRTQLEKLGATPLGGSVTEAELTRAKQKLGHAVPRELAALWRDVDGFCIHDRAGGVNGLRAFLETSSEDVLWNTDFEEQQGAVPRVPLAKLKKLKVLWSLPGQPEAIGIDSKTGKLFFGETNDVAPLKLTLAQYLELALDPDFLEKIRSK